jgi:hypothetical protein
MRLLFLLVIWTCAGSAQTLSDLAWLEGHWETELGGGRAEEIWTKPDGDSIVGMYRFVKDGKLAMTELIEIRALPNGIGHYMRHFHGKLIAWEEKDKPLEWKLVEFAPQSVLWESGGTKLQYELKDPDTLLATLIKSKDGKETRTVFRYRRVR